MTKIGIVIPNVSGSFQDDTIRSANELQITPVFCSGHFKSVVPKVWEMLEREPDIQALIARSTTAFFLRENFDIPVIDLALNDFDFAKTISRLPDKSGKFLVVQFYPAAGLYDVEGLAKVCNIDLKTTILNSDDPFDIVQVVRNMGCDRVVSSVAVVLEPCRRAGIETIPLLFSRTTIDNALRSALYLIENKRVAMQHLEQLLQVLNAYSEGFLAVNAAGRIIMCNQALCNYAGIGNKMVVGVAISEAKESYEFLRLLTEAEDNNILDYQGKKYVVSGPFYPNVDKMIRLWGVSNISTIQEKATTIQRRLSNGGYHARYHFSDIISVSPVIDALKDRARQYARTGCNILIQGESGTGKEMMAQSIHNESTYSAGPFVAVNCAALPENLLESELFGYEEGAFTGARRNGKVGLMELSNGGTLFLDEVGTMSLPIQAKLLRSIQERQISRLGGTKLIPVENRIICATNSNLAAAVAEGSFREDLYYRLDVLHIQIPPLRERTGDIPFLVRTLLRRKGMSHRRILTIDDSLIQEFCAYTWPGNFRQLDAFLERVAVLNQGIRVQKRLLTQLFSELPESEKLTSRSQSPVPVDRGERAAGDYRVRGTLAQVERQVILEAYRRHNGNLAVLTQELGISRTTLWRKLKELGVRNPQEDGESDW